MSTEAVDYLLVRYKLVLQASDVFIFAKKYEANLLLVATAISYKRVSRMNERGKRLSSSSRFLTPQHVATG